MPKRTDLKRIMIIGSGPIVIGQACEFDYSGAQACKALRQEGYEVILINSNPATIMTDPDLADRTYIEPLTLAFAAEVIRKERPDALLSTVGGQTALNLAVELAESGVLDECGVELIGARIDAIKKAEDRLLFKDAMRKIGLDMTRSQLVNNVDDGLEFAERIGYPIILRPSFTLGGSGGGIAYNREELAEILERGIDLSPVHEVLVEESVLGWKEFELEVMRDLSGNGIIVCSIENFDPMGVHTGDSITVAPAQTLTDREYQVMRDAALRCLNEIGVDTGGSNVQFAVNPKNGRMVIVEMNPRVSRSSALASKATGFPIAKIAAKLAVGYRLDEIKNDITRATPACFEPTLDYVVVKIPRWQFEKFPGAEPVLGTQMKSVGEVMAIGRTFKQALGKGIRSLETGKSSTAKLLDPDLIAKRLITPNPERLDYIRLAFQQGYTVNQIFEMTGIDPWFLQQVSEIVALEKSLAGRELESITAREFRKLKRDGLGDRQIGDLIGADPMAVRESRKRLGVRAVFNRVDTCAAEFESFTPYLYSSYESEDEAAPLDRQKVMILGSGPNRIGQGIEFDYCCCHASFALQDFGCESIMVNCNPETVSTDYDTSDRLYFEPLTQEEVLNIYDTERPDGLVVQFGGQTPLNLAMPLKKLGLPIIGTDPADIDLAEDRTLFGKLLGELGIPCPAHGAAATVEQACDVAAEIGLSSPRASQLCARWTRNGHRLQRRNGPALHAGGGEFFCQTPGSDRPLPRGRNRNRRRCIMRRQPRAHSRHHGTYRGGRRALGRQFLRAARYLDSRKQSAHHRGIHDEARSGAERHWVDERPIRVERRSGLCPRSEPARFPNRSFRQQGDRCASAEDRGRLDAREEARRVYPSHRRHCKWHSAGSRLLCEESGVSIRKVSRRGPRVGSRDEIDR